MATKFLDAAGLKYAVGKIKKLIATKQDALTFDSTPTSGSTNPVTSDGVKAYVDQAIKDTLAAATVTYDGKITYKG
jgi:hypothetical protein